MWQAYIVRTLAAIWGLVLLGMLGLITWKFSKALYIKAKIKYNEINNRPMKPFDWRDI